MARELTNGFALAAQIAEEALEKVVAATFLSTRLPVTRTVGSETVEVWFKLPRVHVRGADAHVNAIELEIPLVARLSDRWAEAEATLVARSILTYQEMPTEGQTFVVPVLSFANAPETAFSLTTSVEGFGAPLRQALVTYMRAQLPIPVAPPFVRPREQFFFKTHESSPDHGLLVLFISDARPSPAVPFFVEAYRSSSDLLLLIPRETIDDKIRQGMARRGLGSLPAPLPDEDGLTLNALTIEFRSGHLFITGDIAAGPLESRISFRAWARLSIEDGNIEMRVVRTEHDGDYLFDLAEFLSAGFLTRLLEEAIPDAVRSAAGESLRGMALFPAQVPQGQGFLPAREVGIVDIFPTGLGIPIDIVPPSGRMAAPTYLRGHTLSREFHVNGCQYGDLINRHHIRKFPKWQSAVAAGYDGCATCQPDYNVAVAGEVEIVVTGPSRTDWPEVVAEFVGRVTRFGVALAPYAERVHWGGRGVTDDGLIVTMHLPPVVPGPWNLSISWGGWSISGTVTVERRWTNANRSREGKRTIINARVGDAQFEVTYE